MKDLSRYLPAVAVLIAASWTAAADDATNQSGIEGRYASETRVETIDASGRGAFHAGELEDFRASVFAGMDNDSDGRVSYDEFSSWDPGFRFVADDEGRLEAYTTASKIVFCVLG